MLAYKQTDIQAGRKLGRPIDRQTDRQTGMYRPIDVVPNLDQISP
jgi:hypothetical protein